MNTAERRARGLFRTEKKKWAAPHLVVFRGDVLGDRPDQIRGFRVRLGAEVVDSAADGQDVALQRPDERRVLLGVAVVHRRGSEAAMRRQKGAAWLDKKTEMASDLLALSCFKK